MLRLGVRAGSGLGSGCGVLARSRRTRLYLVRLVALSVVG